MAMRSIREECVVHIRGLTKASGIEIRMRCKPSGKNLEMILEKSYLQYYFEQALCFKQVVTG